MLDHISIPVADLALAAAFYDSVLRCLGLERRKERVGAVGYGPASRAAPVFWLLQRGQAQSATAGAGLHISFEAPDQESVEAFHRAALAAGGKDAGAPGPRPQYTQPFFGAFALDLDGYKIEATCRR